jgi:hypothetical protein
LTFHHAAQIAAAAHEDTARSLHLISLLRGRFDVLETAIAGQDARTRLRVLTQIHDLFEELRTLSAAREIA